MMVTRFIVCSTIQSKVVTTVPAKQTSIVWLKCQTLLSTSVWHRVYHSLANMVVCWITAHSVVLRYPVRSMPVVRLDNSCYCAYSALSRQIGLGKVKMYTRHEMLDVVKVDGRARGIIARNLITGKIERFAAHAVVVATGGYVNTFFLSTNAMASNGSAAWQCYKKGAYFANPCMVQIHRLVCR